jgi:hypothetical protein
MPSSSIGHFPNSDPINVSDISSFESQPEMCDCQNQLGHWDWDGVPRENLPKICQRSMGINIENELTSHGKGEFISDGYRAGTDIHRK